MADDNKLVKMAPEVRTLARPTSESLLAARGVMQRSQAAQDVCLRAKAEGWDAERLAAALSPVLNAELEQPGEEAVSYLAAEYLQLGDTMLLIDRTTGRALARITDDDIWQGPMVPRESGGMAKPLPRLNPNLEAFLYQHVHTRDREANLLATLSEKTASTALLREEGDRRLRMVTAAGRRQILAEIQSEAHPFALATGLVESFHRHLPEISEADSELTLVSTSVAMARVRTNVSDPTAMSFRFDHQSSHQIALVNEWTREIARNLSADAHAAKPPFLVPWGDLAEAHTGGARFWIVDPMESTPFLRLSGVSILYVAGAKPLGFVGAPAGGLLLNRSSLHVEGREISDRWDVVGRFGYSAYLDLSQIVTIELTDVPPPVLVGEVIPR